MAHRNTTGTRAFPPAIMAIKTKLEAIAALWRYVLLMRPCRRLTIEPVYGRSKDTQDYEVEEDYADFQPSTKPRLPTGTADDLVRALIMWNFCLLSSFVVTEVLNRTLDGAKFELGNMTFLAKARFRFERATRGHTVVTIANKEDGKIHILDLTLEQFGWPKED